MVRLLAKCGHLNTYNVAPTLRRQFGIGKFTQSSCRRDGTGYCCTRLTGSRSAAVGGRRRAPCPVAGTRHDEVNAIPATIEAGCGCCSSAEREIPFVLAQVAPASTSPDFPLARGHARANGDAGRAPVAPLVSVSSSYSASSEPRSGLLATPQQYGH